MAETGGIAWVKYTLIFIGSGAVGKTSLVNALISGHMGNPEKTVGIDIKEWKINRIRDGKTIKLNVWDFGGQEIMHATHKFFMTNRSIYVLVINPRIEDKQGDSELEYWLKLIQSYTKKEGVPIVVVTNKSETHKVDLAKETLKRKYPNIVNFIETSCVNSTGIDELKNTIKEAVKELKHIDEELPKTYFLVKENLENINQDYIQYFDYQKICKSIDRKFDEQSMKGLVRILHDLGVMLNYGEDRRLFETQVLNPEWVTNGVYQIITSEELLENKGVLTYDDISDILNKQRYPTFKERSYIIDIMERFELSFQLENKKESFFIPGAFPKDPPKIKWNYNSSDNIRFLYKYDVLPSSIISRFMVKVHRMISGEFYWRNGVVIFFENCFALIKADIQERKIFIEVDGVNKRSMLSLIREKFESLHHGFSGIDVSRFIPVELENKKVLISYDDLLLYEEAKEELIFIPSLKKKYSVINLLEGVEKRSKKQSKKTKLKNVFLSYSHKDEELKEKLEVHLKSLERQNLISPWNDRMIKPGDEWGEEIFNNLKKADLVLLLISPDFIASDFCYIKEMKEAINQHEKGKSIVVPIILRACNWHNTPFGKLQALPKDGFPVKSAASIDDSLNEIIIKISSLLVK
jgi:internalin A